MKKQSETMFKAINAETSKNLTTVVKETLAAGLSQARTFSAAELWNIQRRSRTMVSRRNFAF